jgi:hypothetical protein
MKPKQIAVKARAPRTEGYTLRIPVQVYVKVGEKHRYHELKNSSQRIDVKPGTNLARLVSRIHEAIVSAVTANQS